MLFPKDAVAVAEDESGDALLLLPGEDRPVAWRMPGGDLEPLAVDWSRRSPGRPVGNSRTAIRGIETALLDLQSSGNAIQIGVPGTPAVVELASESDGIQGTASVKLTPLQAHHVGDQMNRELIAQGWSLSPGPDPSQWTRWWPRSEDPRVIARDLAETFENALGLDVRHVRLSEK